MTEQRAQREASAARAEGREKKEQASEMWLGVNRVFIQKIVGSHWG